MEQWLNAPAKIGDVILWCLVTVMVTVVIVAPIQTKLEGELRELKRRLFS